MINTPSSITSILQYHFKQSSHYVLNKWLLLQHRQSRSFVSITSSPCTGGIVPRHVMNVFASVMQCSSRAKGIASFTYRTSSRWGFVSPIVLFVMVIKCGIFFMNCTFSAICRYFLYSGDNFIFYSFVIMDLSF